MKELKNFYYFFVVIFFVFGVIGITLSLGFSGHVDHAVINFINMGLVSPYVWDCFKKLKNDK